MSEASRLIAFNLVLLALSLACALFAATRPRKEQGFFRLPPALRGVIAFLFGPSLVGFAIVLWPITLYIWYLRRRNLANYVDNSEMLRQLRKQGPVEGQ